MAKKIHLSILQCPHDTTIILIIPIIPIILSLIILVLIFTILAILITLIIVINCDRVVEKGKGGRTLFTLATASPISRLRTDQIFSNNQTSNICNIYLLEV